MFMSTIIHDGRVIGTWRRTIKKNLVSIAYSTFKPLSVTQHGLLREQAVRFGAFLGLPLDARICDLDHTL